MKFHPLNNHRILVIDNNRATHDDYRKILTRFPDVPDSGKDEAALFGDTAAKFQSPIFEISSAYQGLEGLDLIEKSLRKKRPYALAFVDVRMPPGWDGIETISKIWEMYSELEVVICTAYSDYSWEEMVKKLGRSDRMIVLKKPFDTIEVLQLAVALTTKWRMNQQAKLRLDNLEKIIETWHSR